MNQKDLLNESMIKMLSLEGQEPKRTKKQEGKQKEYRYITNHGVGPGTIPEKTYIRSEELTGGKTAIYLNRPLTVEELKKYDIKPEWIQESVNKVNLANIDEDTIDPDELFDLREDMIVKLNNMGKPDEYWDVDEVYNNCAITENENGYKEIYVLKDKQGNILYSTDLFNKNVYRSLEDAYKACKYKSTFEENKKVCESNNNEVVEALEKLKSKVETFEELDEALSDLLDDEIINDDQYSDFKQIASAKENECTDYIRRRSDVTNTDYFDEVDIEMEYVNSAIEEMKESIIKIAMHKHFGKESTNKKENKKVCESETAREAFERQLAKYKGKRNIDDIKVVAETDDYLLTATKDDENPKMINLSITTSSDSYEKGIQVYIDQDYKGKVEKAKVNWSAIGSVSADEAEAYGKSIIAAAEFCKEIEGKDYSDLLNK